MAEQNIQEIVKGIIQTQIVQALNDAPEVIEKLVKASLSKPVDKNGRVEGETHYSPYGGTMPYLDWMVGQEIRCAATNAVHRLMQEYAPKIEEEVRKGLNSDTVVAAVTKSFVTAAEQDWRINVKFEVEDKKSY